MRRFEYCVWWRSAADCEHESRRFRVIRSEQALIGSPHGIGESESLRSTGSVRRPTSLLLAS
jgi:hypothetical protein